LVENVWLLLLIITIIIIIIKSLGLIIIFFFFFSVSSLASLVVMLHYRLCRSYCYTQILIEDLPFASPPKKSPLSPSSFSFSSSPES
jgi:hypothetical protein